MAKLDKRTVAALPGLEPGKFDVIHWDDSLPGFGLRVLASGARSWVVRYRVGKRQRVVTLAKAAALKPEDARREAGRTLAKAKIGQDTRAEIIAARVQASDILRPLIDRYIAEHVEKRQRPRTQIETRRHLLVHWAKLHELPIAQIGRRTVADQLAAIEKKSGPVAANRSRASLSALFVWAIKRGLAENNPVAGTAKAEEKDARDHVLSGDDLRAIWQATEGPGDYRAIVRLLLLTGQRREEVAGMRWSEIDANAALWTLPKERTKNGALHKIPLSDAALAMFGAVPRRPGRELVFGEGSGGFSGWSRAKARLDAHIAQARAKAAGLDEPDSAALKAYALEPWTLHDLRRTFSTVANDKLGILPHVVEAILNHISGHKADVAGVYNRAEYITLKRQALDRWADHIMAIVAEQPAKVVPLHRAGA